MLEPATCDYLIDEYWSVSHHGGKGNVSLDLEIQTESREGRSSQYLVLARENISQPSTKGYPHKLGFESIVLRLRPGRTQL
jgi:hypothetical protein